MTLTVYGQMRNVLNNKKRTFLGTPRLSIKLFHNTEGCGKRTSFPNGIRSRNSFPTRKTAGFKAFKPPELVCLFFCLNKSKSGFRLRCRLCRHHQRTFLGTPVNLIWQINYCRLFARLFNPACFSLDCLRNSFIFSSKSDIGFAFWLSRFLFSKPCFESRFLKLF